MLSGKRFHNFAAASGNALFPYVLYFVLRMFNFDYAFDMSEYLPSACIVNILVM